MKLNLFRLTKRKTNIQQNEIKFIFRCVLMMLPGKSLEFHP